MDTQGNTAGQGKQFYNVADFMNDLRTGRIGPRITGDAAYKLGLIDGRLGLPDYAQHAAPLISEYAQGRAVGEGKVNERLTLGTPIIVCNGVLAVVSGHSTADVNSYRISWFDRHSWSQRHKWTDRVNFEVVGAAESATADVPAAITLSA